MYVYWYRWFVCRLVRGPGWPGGVVGAEGERSDHAYQRPVYPGHGPHRGRLPHHPVGRPTPAPGHAPRRDLHQKRYYTTSHMHACGHCAANIFT